MRIHIGMMAVAAAMMVSSVAAAQGQDGDNGEAAVRMIRASRERCEALQSGHYVMEKRWKSLDSKDTTLSRHTCDFRRTPEDTIFGMRFAQYTEWLFDTVWGGFHTLYTGREYVDYDTGDSTGTIRQCDLWADNIIALKGSLDFYAPLNHGCYPLPLESMLTDSEYVFSLSEAVADGTPSHHVRALTLPKDDGIAALGIKCIRHEINLWLDPASLLPTRYDESFVLLEAGGRDTTTQYKEWRLTELSATADEAKMAMEAIPDYVSLADYAPRHDPEPLAEGTEAPDWTLPALDGGTVGLADLRGKVVLVDFFYRKCAPCLAAMPVLQGIHERYGDRGVVVLGIDPMDDPVKDDMAAFLRRREISYPILFSDDGLPTQYHVSAYPTLVIIDREGRVSKVHRGFSTALEGTIEEQLQKMLE